tara:strand:+ start:679 stop:813 length:135 start_codon:yes stop_codon:yes gene_type:complete
MGKVSELIVQCAEVEEPLPLPIYPAAWSTIVTRLVAVSEEKEKY